MISESHKDLLFDVSTFIRLPFIAPIFFEETTRNFTRDYFVLYLDTRDDKIKVWTYTARNTHEAGYGVPLDVIDNTSIEIEYIDDLFDFPLMLENGHFFIAQAEFLRWLFGKAKIRTAIQYLYDILFLQHVTLTNIITGGTVLRVHVPNSIKTISDVLGKSVAFDGTSNVKLYPNSKTISFNNVNCGILFKQALSNMNLLSRFVFKLRVRLREYRLKVALIKHQYTF